ncbi:hypothetical protein HELRODRAFT_193074 [Helobdella robusta]|uniref:C-type lectin domain-containing protein n=1 Tax=Helobdella robusta TaxID=6412 RepID=T1FUL6_HELRO|nr:hypothetical protein HELRODRAFT_193074 [Helobdella robusta]ESN98061.1 hypothetical protein HELRODRAFT_193074 [Helobdella robusta]
MIEFFILKFQIVTISFVYVMTTTSGYQELCDERYCLYSNFTYRLYNGLTDADNECRQLNRDGWLLEVYDGNVSSLVDRFISQYYWHLDRRNIPLNMNHSGDWFWLNKVKCNIEDQVPAARGIAYIKRTYDATRQVVLGYFADYFSSSKKAICKIESNANVLHSIIVCRTNFFVADANSCSQWSSWSYKSSCYFLYPYPNTWYQQENECIRQGGDLAVFDDLPLSDFNRTWLNLWGDDGYWVGLSRYNFMWRKADSAVKFSKWKSGHPDFYEPPSDFCSAISHADGSYWVNNVRCNDNYVIICMTGNETSNDIPTNGELTQEQKIGLGVGLGLPLCLLLVGGSVLAVVCLWRKKLACFKKLTSPQPRRLQEYKDPIYAYPVVSGSQNREMDTTPKPDIVYVVPDFSGHQNNKNNNKNENNNNKTNNNNNTDDVEYDNSDNISGEVYGNINELKKVNNNNNNNNNGSDDGENDDNYYDDVNNYNNKNAGGGDMQNMVYLHDNLCTDSSTDLR